MSELIIETKGLTKSFGNFTAVENLNLKVKKGSLYGFLGPNGAGKSTTIRMLLDLVKPTKILSEIELIADHLGIINKGKLLFQGTIEELKQKANRDIVIKAEPLYKAEAFLKEKGYTLENREGRLHIYGNKIRIEELNKELVLNGFEVSHLSENKKNLEELFLQMTRGIEEC